MTPPQDEAREAPGLKIKTGSSLTGQTLHTFGTIALGTAVQLAAGIATARAFGPAGKGVLSFAALLLTFAITTGNGVRDAIAFQIGTQRKPPRDVWGAALTLLAFLAPIGFIVFFAVSRVVPSQPAYLFVALAFAPAMYVQVVGILYQLTGRIASINARNTVTIGTGYWLVTLVLVVFFHVGVAGVLWLWVATFVLAALWDSVGLRSMLGGPAHFGDRSLIAGQIVFGSKTALSTTVTFLALRADVFVVSALLPASALGIYTLAIAAAELMLTAARAIFWSTEGRIVLASHGDAAALTARVVRSVLALTVACAAVLFVAGPWLISLVYGGRFAQAGPVLRLLLPGMAAYSVDAPLSLFISVRSGRPGLLLALETGSLLLCTLSALLGVRTIGIEGAALADTVTYLVSFGVKIAILVRLGGVPLCDVLIARPSDVPAVFRSALRRLTRRGGAAPRP